VYATGLRLGVLLAASEGLCRLYRPFTTTHTKPNAQAQAQVQTDKHAVHTRTLTAHARHDSSAGPHRTRVPTRA
jgi:hypothetical protein